MSIHRVLWDEGVLHEYHVVHGADHVGRTLPTRTEEALGFVAWSFVSMSLRWRGQWGHDIMAGMNPYASYLGSREPIEAIVQTPERLASLVVTIGEKRVNEAPAPGKWSAREIVAHLADCEVVFAFRLRQTLAENNPTIQPFDQDKWAAPYGTYNAKTALETFSTLRQWNLALIRSLKPEAFDRRMTHPERGEMTFRTVVETMGGHDLNHIGQLERIAGTVAAAG